MSRVPVLLIVATASVLLLATPARGQSAEEIEKLRAQLGDEDREVRYRAALALAKTWSNAPPATPASLARLHMYLAPPTSGLQLPRQEPPARTPPPN